MHNIHLSIIAFRFKGQPITVAPLCSFKPSDNSYLDEAAVPEH